MFQNIRQQLVEQIREVVEGIEGVETVPDIALEVPQDKQHGDLSCNVAMQLTRQLRKSPAVIAEEVIQKLCKRLAGGSLEPLIAQTEIKNPGFINFFLAPSAYHHILTDILDKKQDFGCSDYGKNKKIQVEFVSANPTGPLSVAHARQAVVGDVLVNILNAVGYDAIKEYYVNDGGNQIRTLGKSMRARALQSLGEEAELPEDGYEGEYVKDIAQQFMQERGVKNLDVLKAIDEVDFRNYAKDYLLSVIQKELEDFGVNFDVWTYESKVATEETIKETLRELEAGQHLYDKEGALWFKSTEFGDDKDRVVRKSDGSYTYLTPDIAYHKNKFERGFEQIINIWGPDHHGYIPRIKAAAQALGKDAEQLQVLIVQLASIYRGGEQVSMSTRKGQFISLREVMEEVGVDASRFFFVMRQISQHLDFDLELAKKQSSDNPVYYIQYAHARICSILTKAKEEAKYEAKTADFDLITEAQEIDLIKTLAYFPDFLIVCARQLEPYSLVRYLQELAVAFHKFYDKCKVIDLDNESLSRERLGLINATRIVLANGLSILGISSPEKM